MGSDRTRRREGSFAVMAGVGLVAAGAVIDRTWAHGFWGTLAVAVLLAIWLVTLTSWMVSYPRNAPPAAAAIDGEDDRLMLRVLLDQAPGALLAIEDGGRVRALNRAARRLFATDDRVLPPPAALLSPDAQRLRHGGRSWRNDRVTVGGGGASPRIVAALVDVEAEEHAAEARATRELLRVMGHEVMNALAPITSLAESALGVLDAPERRDRLLPEILGTLSRRTDGLRRFTEAYRQVARLPAPTLVPVRLADLFADLARLFEGEWQDRAVLAIMDPRDAVASLDRDQVVQALLAILRNAAEAGTAVAVPAIVRVSVDHRPDRLTFSIVDEGRGIDAAHTASIFLPFFTTKADGNGIGLAAARQIAQGHGGDVALRRTAPTTFAFIVPG